MPTATVEDYVKRIYLEQQRSGSARVPLGRLAKSMDVVPGTVTTMVKALAEAKLVVYEPRQGVSLTSGGEKLALHVLRRHRLIELFLVKVLGIDWAEVHDEAEQLEHAISDRLIDRFDEFLGRPEFDPHGDPIPTAAGKVSRRALRPLSDCKPAQRVRVARLADQDSSFLRYATRQGLVPDAVVTIESHDAVGDSITVSIEGKKGTLTLGGAAASKILVSAE